MSNEIDIKKPLVRVEIKKKDCETEYLYWEWTVEEFREKRKQTYVVFPRHNLRHVLAYHIADFEQITEKTELSQDEMIQTLSQSQQGKVRTRIKQFKSNTNRNPSNREVQSMIEWAIDPVAWERKNNW